MISLKIPIENKVAVLIGDIYVHYDIRFNTQHPPRDRIEEMGLNELHSRLHQLGYEIAAKMTVDVEKALREAEKS